MLLSRLAARTLMLAAQGLDKRSTEAATKEDVLATIRRMHALQIDTINVVARSPYLVLWSRLGNYDINWLDELLAEGDLFEYWSHAACFVPIEDYALYRRLMLEGSFIWGNLDGWLTKNSEVVERVLGHIRENGEVMSSTFERTDGKQGGWWNWKPEKTALDALHTHGELMIRRRQKFQRVYDLRERILPDWSDINAPPISEVKDTFFLMAAKALGVAKGDWIITYFYARYHTKKAVALARLKVLADEGLLLRVEVEGWNEPGYIHPDNLSLAKKAVVGKIVPTLTTLLSPFDPLVRDRALASDLFDFDYLIECYTPEPKRRYGYFSLPILRRGELVGRLDAKAHRKDSLFEVKAFHLEPGIVLDDALIPDIGDAIRECAVWHGTPDVVIRKSDPVDAAGMLTDYLTVAFLPT